ncbi:hypothetical protein E4T56_gene8373 [Termitomyces sp. T112]|nr:hypothetical protein E4T56_gene8373 [Termitomyces sp. T112]
MNSLQGTPQVKDSQGIGEDRFEALKLQLKMSEEVAREKEVALGDARKEIEELTVKLEVAYNQNLKMQKQMNETNELLAQSNKQLEKSKEECLQQAMRGDALDLRIGFLNFAIRELQNELKGTEEGVMYVPVRDGDNKQSASTSDVYKIVCSDFSLEDALKRRYADTDADAGFD